MNYEALSSVMAALNEVAIEKQDFRDALNDARPGNLVHLDPLYLPVSDTSEFSGYTARPFRKADLGELVEMMGKLPERGASWVISNQDTEAATDLLCHGEIIRFTTRRSVAAQNRRDSEPRHSPGLIVMGRP